MIRQAGELKQLISIQQKTGGQLPSGYTAPVSYLEVARVRAKAEDATYREFYAAAAANVRSAVNYWIRYRPGIEAGMWVENLAHPGERARILQVNRGQHDNRYLLLRCAQVEGVAT